MSQPLVPAGGDYDNRSSNYSALTPVLYSATNSSPACGDNDNRSSNFSALTPVLDSATNSSPSPTPPGPVKLTAKGRLYQLCAQSRWKPPVFDCCNEEGPDNLKLYTYKVSFEMKEGSSLGLAVECIGKPQGTKKSAADSAAEGALWYLIRLGYPDKLNPNKKLKI